MVLKVKQKRFGSESEFILGYPFADRYKVIVSGAPAWPDYRVYYNGVDVTLEEDRVAYLRDLPFTGIAYANMPPNYVPWFPVTDNINGWEEYYGRSSFRNHNFVVGNSAAPSFTARGLQYLDVINSSNTVNWFDSKGVKSGGLVLDRSKPPTHRPKKPVYFQPRLKPNPRPVDPGPVVLAIKPPTRFAGEGLAKFQTRLGLWTAAKLRREQRLTRERARAFERRLIKYEKQREINKSRISSYDKSYNLAHRRYEERLDAYLSAVRKSKDLSYRKAPAFVHGIPPDNPFGRIRATFEGPVGAVYPSDYHWFTRINALSTVPTEYYETIIDSFNRVYHTYNVTSASSDDDIALFGENLRSEIFAAIEPFIIDEDEKCRRKIHRKLRDQVVHVGNIIAERKQTLDLVQSSVKRILGLIKAKKNIFREAAKYARNAKQIASDILAFKFGVEPLMQDISGFAKYLDANVDSPVLVVRANNSAKVPLPITVNAPGFTFVGFLEISYTIKCVVDNPAARSLSQFGLINPLEILWEVTPWSFVVDWFFPVGQWLESKTADCGIIFKTGTRKVRLKGKFTATESSQNQKYDSFVGELIDRKVLTDYPDLPPVRLKNPLSWSHGIESVALAVQRLRIR